MGGAMIKGMLNLVLDHVCGSGLVWVESENHAKTKCMKAPAQQSICSRTCHYMLSSKA